MKQWIMLAASLLAFHTPVSFAKDTAAQSIELGKGFVRAVPPGQKVSAAFMSITNPSQTNQQVVSADSPVAQVVELHTHTHENGMMKMRKIPAIDLPKGKTTLLQPGGLHIMLIGLKKNLTPGQAVPVTLHFADGSHKTTELPVLHMTQVGGGMRGQMGGMQH
jgi:copper(I)-binding protein